MFGQICTYRLVDSGQGCLIEQLSMFWSNWKPTGNVACKLVSVMQVPAVIMTFRCTWDHLVDPADHWPSSIFTRCTADDESGQSVDQPRKVIGSIPRSPGINTLKYICLGTFKRFSISMMIAKKYLKNNNQWTWSSDSAGIGDHLCIVLLLVFHLLLNAKSDLEIPWDDHLKIFTLFSLCYDVIAQKQLKNSNRGIRSSGLSGIGIQLTIDPFMDSPISDPLFTVKCETIA